MRYLKRFDEELNLSTYRSAERKLKQLMKDKPQLAKAVGAEERAKNLADWSKNIESRDILNRWKKNVEEYQKFGEFNFELSRPGSPSIKPKVYSFYLHLECEYESMIDFWEEEEDNNRNICLSFFTGLIPKNLEDIEEIKQLYTNDFFNGFFFGNWININYKVVNSELTFIGINVRDYEVPVQVADRRTANSLKRLLVNCFDSKFDYPSGYRDITNIYDKIEHSVIQALDMSINYGIDMDRIREDIQKLPVINFYKQ